MPQRYTIRPVVSLRYLVFGAVSDAKDDDYRLRTGELDTLNERVEHYGAICPGPGASGTRPY
jgi:hypothetical protein